MPELADDSRFSENAQRVANRDALLARMIPALSQETVTHWLQVLSGAGVPCGPVASVPEALRHEQVEAREMVVEAKHPVYGTVQLVNNATGYSGAQDSAAPPLFSEHSREILRDVLKYDSLKIEDLIKDGTVLESSENES